MKRSPLTYPDEFSQAPLFSILPRHGDSFSLLKMRGAFFARKEKLIQASNDAGRSDEQRELQKKIDCEVRMLNEVLSWIEERSA